MLLKLLRLLTKNALIRSLSRHDTVNHSLREYARGRVHTNTVEAEFSIFRPWTATFRGISKEHLHLYTAHYDLLRNTRHHRVQRTLAILNRVEPNVLNKSEQRI
jgi:transposase-like protein